MEKIPTTGGISSNADVASMQAASQASTPTPPSFIKQTIEDANKQPEVKATDDMILSEGSDTDFWRILKRIIEYKIEFSKSAVREKFATGTLTLEQIGLQSVVRDAVIDNLLGIIQKVEQTREVVEKARINEQRKKSAK